MQLRNNFKGIVDLCEGTVREKLVLAQFFLMFVAVTALALVTGSVSMVPTFSKMGLTLTWFALAGNAAAMMTVHILLLITRWPLSRFIRIFVQCSGMAVIIGLALTAVSISVIGISIILAAMGIALTGWAVAVLLLMTSAIDINISISPATRRRNNMAMFIVIMLPLFTIPLFSDGFLVYLLSAAVIMMTTLLYLGVYTKRNIRAGTK